MMCILWKKIAQICRSASGLLKYITPAMEVKPVTTSEHHSDALAIAQSGESAQKGQFRGLKLTRYYKFIIIHAIRYLSHWSSPPPGGLCQVIRVQGSLPYI
jgi:hypothetical protein